MGDAAEFVKARPGDIVERIGGCLEVARIVAVADGQVVLDPRTGLPRQPFRVPVEEFKRGWQLVSKWRPGDGW